MVSYELTEAHPYYQKAIPLILNRLLERYPFVKLRRVELYHPDVNDTSMGGALEGGIIQLNAYWFSGNPDRLNDAAKRDVYVPAGTTRLAWHGGMDTEPQQVIVHEFMHILQDFCPGAVRWAEVAWRIATQYPEYAPSGYALANPVEFWAEAMTARELGWGFGMLHALNAFLQPVLAELE